MPKSAAESVAREPERSSLGSLIRLAVFRGALVGGVLALLFSWLVFMFPRGATQLEKWTALECGFLLGACFGPLAILERVRIRALPDIVTQLALGVLTASIAYVFCLSAVLQAVYMFGLFEKEWFDFSHALGVAERFVDDIRAGRIAPSLWNMLAVLSIPLLPLTVSRLRRVTLPKTTALTFAVGGIVALPSLVFLYDFAESVEAMWLPPAVSIYLLLLPICLRAADLLEDRAARALRDDA